MIYSLGTDIAKEQFEACLQNQRTALRNQLHALDHSGAPAPGGGEILTRSLGSRWPTSRGVGPADRTHLRSREDLREPIARLKSIPNIGDLTTAAILTETTGFTRFNSSSQFISFSGYDVVIRQSGKWSDKPKIFKQGSRYIRQAIYMLASAVIRSGEGAGLGALPAAGVHP